MASSLIVDGKPRPVRVPARLHRELRRYVRLRHYAAATRRGYLTDQLLFVRFLKAQYGVSRVNEVERRHIVDYLTHAERRGLRGTTIARKLAALRSFFTYLVEDGRITSSPVRGIPPPKQEWAQPRVLSQIEYGRLKAAAERDPRARAIVEIFLQTGIRLSEAAQLRVADVVLPEAQELPSIGLLRVLGKGRKERAITLNSRACQALSAYLTTRTAYDKRAPLFVSKYGASLTPRSIQALSRSSPPMQPSPVPACIRSGTPSRRTRCERERTCASFRRRWGIHPCIPRRATSPWRAS